MKLPSAPAPSTEFKNAVGSDVPQEFAMAARSNPGAVKEMAETPSELKVLTTEALVRNYTLIVDRSGSMDSPDGRFASRWSSAQKAVTKLVEAIFRYDVDKSVPLYLFDDQVEFIGECTDASQIKGVFESYRPRGTTDLAKCLDVAMEKYSGKRANVEHVPGSTFIVILDGGADDPEAVKRVIRKYADPANGYVKNHCDIAISFVQLGEDPSATAFLKDLDDNMKPLDIVDHKFDDDLYKPGGVDKVLMDAIFD